MRWKYHHWRLQMNTNLQKLAVILPSPTHTTWASFRTAGPESSSNYRRSDLSGYVWQPAGRRRIEFRDSPMSRELRRTFLLTCATNAK